MTLISCSVASKTQQTLGGNSSLQTDNKFNMTSENMQNIKNFAYKTAEKILEIDKNSNYAPTSLYYALSMLGIGARNTTESEILSVLEANSRAELIDIAENLNKTLNYKKKDSILTTVSSIWLSDDKGISFKKEYTDIVEKNLKSSIHKVNFSDDKTYKKMTKWVSDNTNKMLSPEFEKNPEQIISILSVVYMKDMWIKPFIKELTAEDTFTTANGDKQKAQFMKSNELGSAKLSDRYKVASLELESGGRMLFALPNEGISVEKLIADEGLKNIFENVETEMLVSWSLPKFEFTTKLNLIENLKKLGINTAFDDRADFSDISDTKAYVSEVNQGTRILVNETGLEAGAYTEVGMMRMSLSPAEKMDMDLNRPFLFAVENKDGIPVFIGHIASIN